MHSLRFRGIDIKKQVGMHQAIFDKHQKIEPQATGFLAFGRKEGRKGGRKERRQGERKEGTKKGRTERRKEGGKERRKEGRTD